MLCDFAEAGGKLKQQQVVEEEDALQSLLESVFDKQDPVELNSTSGAFDDIQWWALAWVRAREQFPQSTRPFLARAVMVWERLQREAWDDTCGGGVWWSTRKSYKNAITNELFLMLSLRLAQHFPHESRFLQWARAEWNWFEHSGMINARGLINDGLRIVDKFACFNNGQTEWTYNQGVILGGLVHLARATHNATLTALAAKLFAASSGTLRCPGAAGILRESCDSCGSDANTCDGDQIQFKGIYMRYVGYWARASPETFPPGAARWVERNAESVWQDDRCACSSTSSGGDDDACMGPNWAGKCVHQNSDAGTQASAMDLLVAAAAASSRKA